MTVHVINSQKSARVTSEREEIVMVEWITAPITLTELDNVEDAM
jgi:hypothetical protein